MKSSNLIENDSLTVAVAIADAVAVSVAVAIDWTFNRTYIFERYYLHT